MNSSRACPRLCEIACSAVKNKPSAASGYISITGLAVSRTTRAKRGRTALQPRGDTLPRDATRQPYDLPVETGGGLALDLFVAFARNAYAIQGHRMASDRRRRFRQGNGRTR